VSFQAIAGRLEVNGGHASNEPGPCAILYRVVRSADLRIMRRALALPCRPRLSLSRRPWASRHRTAEDDASHQHMMPLGNLVSCQFETLREP